MNQNPYGQHENGFSQRNSSAIPNQGQGVNGQNGPRLMPSQVLPGRPATTTMNASSQNSIPYVQKQMGEMSIGQGVGIGTVQNQPAGYNPRPLASRPQTANVETLRNPSVPSSTANLNSLQTQMPSSAGYSGAQTRPSTATAGRTAPSGSSQVPPMSNMSPASQIPQSANATVQNQTLKSDVFNNSSYNTSAQKVIGDSSGSIPLSSTTEFVNPSQFMPPPTGVVDPLKSQSGFQGTAFPSNSGNQISANIMARTLPGRGPMQFPPRQGPLPAPRPISTPGTMPTQAPMPTPGTMPRQAPMPTPGTMPTQRPMPTPGTMPTQAPMPTPGTMPTLGPMPTPGAMPSFSSASGGPGNYASNLGDYNGVRLQPNAPSNSPAQYQNAFDPKGQNLVNQGRNGPPNAYGAPPRSGPALYGGKPLSNGAPHLPVPPRSESNSQMQATAPPLPGTPSVPPRGAGPRPASGSQPAPRIDPEQMPRPKHNGEMKRLRTREIFQDGAANIPSALDSFVAIDDGNANPRFIRMTVNQIPSTHSVLKDSSLPLAALLQPFSEVSPEESPITVIDKRESKLERCVRCYGYQCAYTKYDPSTGWWKCHLCGQGNGHGDPSEMNKGRFDADMYGATGQMDLRFGSVEYLVAGAYAPRNLKPTFVFVLDLTIHALSSKASSSVLKAIKRTVSALSVSNPHAQVGIVSFDSTIEFHDLSLNKSLNDTGRKSKLVTDVDDPFCPMPPKQWLVNVSERLESINMLLDFLLAYCDSFSRQERNNSSPGIQSVASSALFAVIDGLSTTGGKISLFTSALSTRGAGMLSNRENATKYGTDKEFELLKPETNAEAYTSLARKCAETIISLDVYALTSSYVDLAAFHLLANETGGSMHRFTALELADEVSAERLCQTLERNITSVCALDTVMKVRVSNGFRFLTFLGNGHTPVGVQEQYVAYINNDYTVAAVLEHDGSDVTKQNDAYVQLAILYTSNDGQRRLRIHNLALKLTQSFADVFRCVDVDAVTAFLARRAAASIAKRGIVEVRKELNVSAVNMLTAYRKFCAKNPSNQQLILPEALKLLPVYTLGMLKSTLLRTNTSGQGRSSQSHPFMPSLINADARIEAINAALRIPVACWLRLIYPLMTAVQLDGANLPYQTSPLPLLLAPTMAKVAPSSVLFITNGEENILYICDGASPKLLELLTGFSALQPKVLLNSSGTQDLLHPKGQVAHFVRTLSNWAKSAFPLELVRVVPQNSSTNAVFSQMLVEDKQIEFQNMDSYEDFLCKIHSSIKNELMK